MDKVAGSASGGRDRSSDAPHGTWRGIKCSIEDCTAAAKCKGFCNSHYEKTKTASGYKRKSYTAENRRAIHLRARYGIDQNGYDALLRKQGGLCAVCGEPPKKAGRAHWSGKLCVDHDHATGRVRGLLCNSCNLAIGYIQSPETLERAAQYLRDHKRPDSVDNT